MHAKRGIMKLTDLPNIGKKLADELSDSGIDSTNTFMELPIEKIVYMLKNKGYSVCKSKLFAIEGAKHGVRWHELSKEHRDTLAKILDEGD